MTLFANEINHQYDLFVLEEDMNKTELKTFPYFMKAK